MWQKLALAFVVLFIAIMVSIEVVRHFVSQSRRHRFGPGGDGTLDVVFYGLPIALLFLIGVLFVK